MPNGAVGTLVWQQIKGAGRWNSATAHRRPFDGQEGQPGSSHTFAPRRDSRPLANVSLAALMPQRSNPPRRLAGIWNSNLAQAYRRGPRWLRRPTVAMIGTSRTFVRIEVTWSRYGSHKGRLFRTNVSLAPSPGQSPTTGRGFPFLRLSISTTCCSILSTLCARCFPMRLI